MPYNKTLDHPLCKLNGNRIAQYPGDIGIEIEVEGWNLPGPGDMVHAPMWKVVNDGSLRPPPDELDKKNNDVVLAGGAAEYVLKEPVKHSHFAGTLDQLIKLMDRKKSKFVWSNRTSVHVHLNANKMSPRELFSWFTLYYIVEDLITEIAGRDRMGNLFCLRGVDAEEVIFRLIECAQFGQEDGSGVIDFSPLSTDRHMRYSAMNLTAMFKYESVEFRAHHGTLDPVAILRWVNLLYHLREEGRKFRRPSDIIAKFSQLGPMGFVNRYLPREIADMINIMANRDQRLWEGVRLVQPLAFANDWPEPEPEAKKDKLVVDYANAPNFVDVNNIILDHLRVDPPEPPRQGFVPDEWIVDPHVMEPEDDIGFVEEPNADDDGDL